MTPLAHLTDGQRISLLRRVAAAFGLNYEAVSEDDLMEAIQKVRAQAEDASW